MAEITYRLARKEDCFDIAMLHAKSWKIHYRDLCPDHYLEHEVEKDRLNVWQKRFEKNDANQHTLLAINEKGIIIGFVCTILNYHKKWGAYLDNIHVSVEYQGRGIGKNLMKAAATWVAETNPDSQLYLHVLKKNIPAIKFYKEIGGLKIGEYVIELPWGESGVVCDYLWEPTSLKK